MKSFAFDCADIPEKGLCALLGMSGKVVSCHLHSNPSNTAYFDDAHHGFAGIIDCKNL